jgi:tetratricopeptide (TPR) repeat protein
MDAATDNQANLDEFLASLETVGADGSRAELKELVGRASQLFDDDSAQARCAQLFERLGSDAGDRIALESVVILALARPALVERLRLPLAQEGRRLAVLLERGGDAQRAQAVLELLLARAPSDRAVERDLSALMRRNGNLARLVERHLSRADECVRDGRRDEAVRWLREVLMLDPQRRDVARMIRDLNYAGHRAPWGAAQGPQGGWSLAAVPLGALGRGVARNRHRRALRAHPAGAGGRPGGDAGAAGRAR